jgi:2-C-methyl-D-erythritol 2,4-cyclodiphosphate synthase
LESSVRVGFGFDAHGVDERRPLILGGVTIEGAPGLAGHSDADVLSHAVADALLGAAALGDLGTRFPNDDRWRDASSMEILSTTVAMLAEAGWSVVNIDSTVVAESPRLDPYRQLMIANLAGALKIPADAVSVKATTTDGLGFSGRREGMAAYAVALISRVEP